MNTIKLKRLLQSAMMLSLASCEPNKVTNTTTTVQVVKEVFIDLEELMLATPVITKTGDGNNVNYTIQDENKTLKSLQDEVEASIAAVGDKSINESESLQPTDSVLFGNLINLTKSLYDAKSTLSGFLEVASNPTDTNGVETVVGNAKIKEYVDAKQKLASRTEQ